jgi:hypothetical protein
MPEPGSNDRLTLPLQSRAKRAERRKVLILGVISALVFLAIVPFAKLQLPEIRTFIPAYQAALAIADLVTAIVFYVYFYRLRSYGLLLLAGGYLFTALMAAMHTLTFPGLFARDGLLGAGPQTTAWLYMFWHGGFPVMVVGYGLIKEHESGGTTDRRARIAMLLDVLGILAAVAILTLIATAGSNSLPPIMAGNSYTPAMVVVVTTVWACSLAGFLVLWLRMPYSLLDIWLMLVMAAWIFDIALSAVLNAGRFDLGFYAGRLYGLVSGVLVLVVLLIDARIIGVWPLGRRNREGFRP